ncbi:hypothetical protein C0W42_01495 [Photobacterium kishitanii]|uniref:glycosyltransferase n=1 Tax=Photobacterium kishitanii TaxID=318456 RepID=UPI000D155A7C|nr:glycosyltransferase [Photobacterium kishitanii]PSU92808.1 hypothetical protein C0W42_01495 [Photobacterium kishitanii]
MKNIRFSFALSIYDGVSVEQLSNCINSMLAQSYKNFEILIYLDGVEKKDLISYIDGIISDNIFIYSSTINRGLAYGMNKLISNMTGDIFVRMDADDENYPDRLLILNDFFIKNPDIDVVGSAILQKKIDDISDNGTIIYYPEKHADILNQFKYRNPIAHPTVAIRKKVFDLVPSYPVYSLRNEDTLLWLSFFKSGVIFYNIKQPLYKFNYDLNSSSRRVGFKKSYSDFIDRLRVQCDLGFKISDLLKTVLLFFISNSPFYNFIRKSYFEYKNKH